MTGNGAIKTARVESITITHSGYEAVISAYGASVSLLQHYGRDLVVPFDPAGPRPVYRGAILAPWPNRVIGGQYAFNGQAYDLPINETERGHALHGLVADVEWEASSVASDCVTFTTRVDPTAGYPFSVELTAIYQLSGEGLRVELVASNVGARAAPYGASSHPYLTTGSGRVDDWEAVIPAAKYVPTVGPRLLPGTLDGVPPEFDFRDRRALGAVAIDHAFTGLAEGGRRAVELYDRTGEGVRMSWGPELPWLQIHTADRPEPELHRVGLAVEPMTCAPDAFNNRAGLVVLEPGNAHRSAWLIAAISERDNFTE